MIQTKEGENIISKKRRGDIQIITKNVPSCGALLVRDMGVCKRECASSSPQCSKQKNKK